MDGTRAEHICFVRELSHLVRFGVDFCPGQNPRPGRKLNEFSTKPARRPGSFVKTKKPPSGHRGMEAASRWVVFSTSREAAVMGTF